MANIKRMRYSLQIAKLKRYTLQGWFLVYG